MSWFVLSAAGGPGWLGTWAGLALAVAASVLSFPPTGLAYLTPLMFAPVAAALEDRRPLAGFGITWAYFSAFGLLIARWLTEVFIAEYGVAPAPAWIFTVGLVASYALLPGTAGALYCAVRPRTHPALAPLVLASLWALAEWGRSEALGVPWVLVAHALAEQTYAIQMADLIGVYGVGFLLIALNAGLGIAWRARALGPLMTAVIVAGASLGYGAWRLATLEPGGAPLRVAVLHSNTTPGERFLEGSASRNTRRLVEETRALGGSPQLIVWPETAIDGDLSRYAELARSLASLASELGVTLVAGAQRSDDADLYNSVFFFGPSEDDLAVYDKRRLVPFAEEIPSWLDRLVGPLLRNVYTDSPYKRGSGALVVDREARLSPTVCFETTYTDLVRTSRLEGAEVLLNLSNDGWFAASGYGDLHLHHSVFRAVELRAPVVRSANAGVSAVIDARGRILDRRRTAEEGAILSEVRPAATPYGYARWGNAPVLLGFIAIILLSLALGAGRRPEGLGANEPARGRAGPGGREEARARPGEPPRPA